MRAWRAAIAQLARIAVVVRRIIGVPDYDVYVRHMQATHPECRLLTPREFEQQRLLDRYNRPGSRCC